MSVYVPVGDGEWVDPSEWRPATAQEKVAALREEGGQVVEVGWQKHLGLVDAAALVEAVRNKPGRYLVVRIEGETDGR